MGLNENISIFVQPNKVFEFIYDTKKTERNGGSVDYSFQRRR